jgi:hypothetical protein
MPNPWTGKGNPYTREEVRERLRATLAKGDAIIAAGAGTGRQVELDQVSINSVARIEVNRSPVPDTPGSALAGSVNFVPRSAFERNKPIYTYSVAFLMKDAERAFLRQSPGPGWGEKSYKIHPGFDVSAVVPVNKNFGFTISGGFSDQYTPQSNTAMQWRGVALATNPNAANGTPGALPQTTPDNPYLGTFSWRDSGKTTTRESFATTVDWRPFGSRHDRITVGFSYGMLKENFATRTQTFTINRVAPGNWSPTRTQGALSTFPLTGAINSGQFTIGNGGRIRHHLRHNLGSAKNHILFVGYQSVGTLGRLLVDGIDSIKLFGDDIKIKAHRHTIGGLSAHTDQAGLLEWYGAFTGHPPVALVHGEDDARNASALALKMRFDVDANVPGYGTSLTI